MEPFTSRTTVRIWTRFSQIICITLQKMKNNTTEKWKSNHNWHFTSYVKTKNKQTNMKTQGLKKVRVHQRYSGAVLSVLMWSCAHRCSQCEETQSSPSAAQIRTQAQSTAQYNEAAVNVSIVAESRWGEVSPRFTNQISINVTESVNSRLWLRSGNNGLSVRVCWKVLSIDSCTCYKYLL